MSTIYRHYGADKFDYNKTAWIVKGSPVRQMGKPNGLWASPLDEDAFTWYKWCQIQDFHVDKLDKYFDFTIKEDSKILHIYKEEDILPYIIRNKLFKDISFSIITGAITDVTDSYDINKLHAEFDGMELHLSQNYEELRYSIFCGWDVDSIVIWNPDIIIPIEETS